MSYSSGYQRQDPLFSTTSQPAAPQPSSVGDVIKTTLAPIDPTAGLLAGVVSQFIVGIGTKVGEKAQTHISDRLTELLTNRLGQKESARLLAGKGRDDWAQHVRDRISWLVNEDPAFARSAATLVFGDGGVGEAIYQLPAVSPTFSNRKEEVRQIRQVLSLGLRRRLFGRRAPTVIEIAGPPMAGKSELAIRAAHELARDYPDGCFVVDLGGPLGWSSRITDGLVDILRAQGMALGKLPETRQLALNHYRSWFRGKRALVIIENATDMDDVRAFLPPDRRCAAIVTADKSVLDLPRQQVCTVRPFGAGAGSEMLRQLDHHGQRWEDASGRSAATEVLRWCGYHPAIIAAVAAWISQPDMVGRTGSSLATELWKWSDGSSARTSLAPRLRITLTKQYEAIAADTPDAARLFRLLGLSSIPYVDAGLAAALAGVTMSTAQSALDRLLDGGVLRLDDGLYQMTAYHQRYAESLARERDSEKDRSAALVRLFRHLLERNDSWAAAAASNTYSLVAASRIRRVWLAAVGRAFAEGMHEWVCRLAAGCAAFFAVQRYWAGWEATSRLAVLAAAQLPTEEARLTASASAQFSLTAALWTRRKPKAAASYRQSLRRIRQLATYGLAAADTDGDAARRCLQESDELFRTCRDERYPAADGVDATELLAAAGTEIERLRRRIE